MGPKKKNKLNENDEYDVDNMTEEEISVRLKEITKNIPEDNPIIIDGVKYAPKSWNTDDLDEWDRWARETFGLLLEILIFT